METVDVMLLQLYYAREVPCNVLPYIVVQVNAHVHSNRYLSRAMLGPQYITRGELVRAARERNAELCAAATRAPNIKTW